MKKILLIIVLLIIIGGVYFWFFFHNSDETNYKMIIADNLVTDGAGLYEDNVTTGKVADFPYASKYYFRGHEVNNHFWHDNFCFKILHITVNNKIKLVLDGYSDNKTCENVQKINQAMPFSPEKDNDWFNSQILTTLETWQEEGRMFDKPFNYDDIFVTGNWYSGNVDSRRNIERNIPNSLIINIEQERDEDVYQGKVGIISQSEYLKTMEGLQATYARNEIPRNTFLYTEWNFWTLTGDLHDDERVYAVQHAEELDAFEASDKSILSLIHSDSEDYTIFPAFYIDGELKFTGVGTREDPYQQK